MARPLLTSEPASSGEGAERPTRLVHTQAGDGKPSPADPSSAEGSPSAPQVASVSPVTALSTCQLYPPPCQGDVSSEIHRYPLSSPVFKKETAVRREARSLRL